MKKQTIPLDVLCPSLILIGFFIFLCFWNKIYFSDAYTAGWDLPGQIATVDRMMAQLPHFRFSFYDPGWFFGWGVDLFYAPLFHILTAILAYPLSLISKNPAQFACHIGLAVGCAALPFSIWYFLLPMAKSISQGHRLTATSSSILALTICFSSFWFLNHDNQFFGLGFASVMGIGLYTQLSGWHLLFLHAGAVVRLIATGEKKSEYFVLAFYTLLFFSHSLTAVFALGFTFLLALWYQQFALRLLRLHILAIAMTGFWLVPALAYSRTYAVTSMVPGTGDILELLFRYPLSLLLRHFESAASGHFSTIDFGTLLLSTFFFLFIPLGSIRRSQLAITYFIIDFIALFFSNSGFIARCWPITMHYYRFLGYEVLYLSALLALVPLGVVQSFTGNQQRNYQRLALVGLTALIGCGIYSTIRFPMPEHQKTIDHAGKGPPYQDEVLDYFKKLPQKGRVFFEIFEDESKYGLLAAHYMESRLFKETGFESANGLFIESANSYRLPVTSANILGAHAWATSQIFGNDQSRFEEQAIRQLKEFGITHVVCGSDTQFFYKLKKRCISEVAFIGPYAVCQIAPLPFEKVLIPDKNKILIGYVDKAGTLPFEFLQAYIFTRDNLCRNMELIDFTKRKLVSNTPIVVINSPESNSPIQFPQVADPGLIANIHLFGLSYSHFTTLDHYNVWHQDNPEYDSYKDVVAYLDKEEFTRKILVLREKILAARKNQTNSQAGSPEPLSKPELQWATDFQSLDLRNLQPGEFVKLNYSYLPFWHSNAAQIFKGTNEQIYVLPQAQEVHLAYDQWVSPYFWVGTAVSAAAVLSLFVDWQIWLTTVARHGRELFGKRKRSKGKTASAQ